MKQNVHLSDPCPNENGVLSETTKDFGRVPSSRTESCEPTSTEIADYVKTCPEMSRQIMGRALSGKSRSPRDAIKATCLSCSGFARDEAAGCTVWRCALWALNPYRAAAHKKGQRSASESEDG